MQQGVVGTVRVLAGGPGTGKTTRLRDSALELLTRGDRGVCVIARDARAARAMRADLLGKIAATDAVTVTTFHALALSTLRRGWRLLGYSGPPALLSGPEQFGLVKELLDAPQERDRWDTFARARALRGFVTELREFILRVQDADEDPDTLSERAKMARRPDLGEAARFFRRYLDLLDDREMVDHANAICQTTTLLTPNEVEDPNAADARERLISQIAEASRHLLVDDIQTASPAMLNLLRRLALRSESVTVALDPDAPSFSFRGGVADPAAALRERFPNAEIIELNQRLRAMPEVRGRSYPHVADEIDGIVADIATAHHEGGIGFDEIAVIVRRLGPDAEHLHRALERAQIPVSVVGENRALHAEPALQPMFDLVTVATSVAERDEALPRLLASLVGGLGPVRFRALVHYARRRGEPLEVLFAAPDDSIPEGLRTPLLAIRALVDEFAETEQRVGADQAAWWLWERLDHQRALVADGDDTALDAVVAFHTAVARYTQRNPNARLGEFVEILRAADFGAEPLSVPNSEPDAVRIMTAFAALGQEARIVFVPGCADRAYPDLRERTFALDARDLFHPSSSADRLRSRAASEERLFASILARSTGEVVVTYAREGTDRGVRSPSPVAERAGIRFQPAQAAPSVAPFSRDAIEAFHRRRLNDPASSPTDRDDSLSVLATLPGVDPDGWWFQREWTDPGVPLHADGLRTSQSHFATYDDCGLRYLLKSELGLDQAESHQMAFGSLIHSIIEDASIASMESGAPPALDALLASLEERWDPAIFDNAAMEHRRRRDAEDMIRRWHAADASDIPLAVEASFSFQHGPATVRGKIDRIVRFGPNGTRVTDYKTSRQPKSDAEIREDLQLAVYYLAGKREPELQALGSPKRVELAYVGGWKGGVDRVGFLPDEGFEEEVAGRLDEIFDGIINERFAPDPSSDCRYCAFKQLCPLWPVGDEVTL